MTTPEGSAIDSSPGAPRGRRPLTLAALGLVLLALAAAALSPFTRSHWIYTHDMVAYPVRAIEYVVGWRSGAIWPRWAPDLYGGFGCALFNFYAPGMFILSGLPLLLGTSAVTAIKLTVLVYTFAGLVGLFGFVYGEVKRSDAAMLAVLLFLVYPYHTTILFVRGDLSEYGAHCLVPLVLWAYRALDRAAAGRRFIAIGCAAAGLHAATLLTHTLTGQWLTELLLFLMLWQTGRNLAAGDGWRALALPIVFGAGCGLTMIYALPALLERPLVHIERMTQGPLATAHNFVELDWLRSPAFFFTGWAVLLTPLVVLAACLARRRLLATPLVLALTGALLCGLMLRGAAPVWQWLPFSQYIQFPWRLLGFIGTFAALAWGCAAAALLPRRAWLAWPLVLAVAALAAYDGRRNVDPTWHPMPEYAVPESPLDVEHGYYTTVVSDEYLPRGALKPRAQASFLGALSGCTVDLLLRSGLGFRVEVGGEANSWFELRSLWYPGWKVELRGGPAEPTVVQGESGDLRVILPRKGYYSLRVQFGLTPLRLLATVLTWLTLLALPLLLFWIGRRVRPPVAA